MADRLELQALLEGLLESRNVYFDPPDTTIMKYPCIRYERNDIDIKHADNRPYLHRIRYSLTVMDRNPDSLIPKAVSELPTASFDRHYTAENLHHDVFTLFF